MNIIVGLGNPGKKYEDTRHNAGFLALDFVIEKLNSKIEKPQDNFDSKIFNNQIDDHKIILVKPQTFMNESGKAVKAICDFYKINCKTNLLILHDDIDLPFGTIRLTKSSSSAGHNGVQDIIDKLGTQDFQRIRIGIESRASKNDIPTDAFVLQNFSKDELQKLRDEIMPNIKLEIEKFLKN